MYGYPRSSFWIPRALAKFFFLHIFLNLVSVGITHRKPEYLVMRSNKSRHRPLKKVIYFTDFIYLVKIASIGEITKFVGFTLATHAVVGVVLPSSPYLPGS